MKTKVYERYQNGELIERVETPYTAEDYLADIEILEAEMTPRRQRDALLTEGGRLWLAGKDAEVQAVRAEMKAALVAHDDEGD